MAFSDRVVLPAIRQLMAEQDFCTLAQIAETAECSPKTAERAVKRLIDAKLLTVEAGGRKVGTQYGFPTDE